MRVGVDHPSPPQCLVFLQEVLGSVHPRDFSFRLWDGSVWNAEPGEPSRFTMVLRNPGALRAMFWSPSELALGEAYLYNDLDIEGDIGGAFLPRGPPVSPALGLAERLRFARLLLALPPSGRHRGPRPAERLRGPLHSMGRDRQTVTYHYDMSNAFYSLWLDERMVYSCAYFTDPGDDLDTAQERKLEYLCRKRGCNAANACSTSDVDGEDWSSTRRKNFGVQAHGITLSGPRRTWQTNGSAKPGFPTDAGSRSVTIGKSGRRKASTSWSAWGCSSMWGSPGCWNISGAPSVCFGRAAVFLNHGIACIPGFPPDPRALILRPLHLPGWGTVTARHDAACGGGQAGFEVRDVESLREHYVLTLRHWVQRLEARREEACSVTDEKTYRLWRLYLAGAAHKFRVGQNSVYQVLLSKTFNGESGLPLTRAGWYAAGDFNASDG